MHKVTHTHTHRRQRIPPPPQPAHAPISYNKYKKPSPTQLIPSRKASSTDLTFVCAFGPAAHPSSIHHSFIHSSIRSFPIAQTSSLPPSIPPKAQNDEASDQCRVFSTLSSNYVKSYVNGFPVCSVSYCISCRACMFLSEGAS